MSFGSFGRELRETLLSLAPALLLIVSFQVVVLRQPWSEFWPVALGLVATVIGFVLFIEGAKLGLLPLGRSIGNAFIERRALVPLLTFGLLLGIVLTVAEPDVRLLAYQMEGVLEGFTTRSTLILVRAFAGSWSPVTCWRPCCCCSCPSRRRRWRTTWARSRRGR